MREPSLDILQDQRVVLGGIKVPRHPRLAAVYTRVKPLPLSCDGACAPPTFAFGRWGA